VEPISVEPISVEHISVEPISVEHTSAEIGVRLDAQLMRHPYGFFKSTAL
jgi:hypothetical protein